MFCLRCGRETQERQVFCEECLADMARHPVKPGTAIHLPTRPEKAPVKAARRSRSIPPEEQAARLRRVCKRLSVAVVVLALVVCLLGAALLHAALRPRENKQIGRNYTAVNSGQQGTAAGETPGG